jgi:hypothetical protein
LIFGESRWACFAEDSQVSTDRVRKENVIFEFSTKGLAVVCVVSAVREVSETDLYFLLAGLMKLKVKGDYYSIEADSSNCFSEG